MSNRRLIAMIRGRATAGDPLDLSPLAARPPVVSALSHLIGAVGATGLLVAVVAAFAGGLVGPSVTAASARTGATEVPAASGVVSGQAASDPVPGAVQGIGGTPRTTPGTLPGRHVKALLQGIVVPTAGALPVATPATILPTPARTTPTTKPAPTTSTTAAARPAAVQQAASPTTTVAPRPAAPAPAAGSVEAIILEVFGAHGREAIGVARCESHLTPAAVSRNGANWGLFQINTAHRSRVAQMGYRWQDLLDPRVNALVAKSIFDEQGWRPWGCRGAAR